MLDIQCGNGRHTVELAKRGFHPMGLDICAEFLTMLKEQERPNNFPSRLFRAVH
ncbi:methyltransferase domain-containing protein [Spirosoma arcticum]